MKALMNLWLEIWLYVAGLIALGLTAALIAQWDDISWVTRLIWMSVIILPLHAWEEWRLPGGLHYGYNLIMHKSDIPDVYPMNRLSDMITICLALLFGVAVLLFFSSMEIVAIGMMFFCMTEVIMHTFAGLLSLKMFKSKGKRTIYNPGLGTSYALFLPVGLGFIALIHSGQLVLEPLDWFEASVWFIGVVLTCVLAPEILYRNKNTSFPFKERGYWEKYSK